MYSGDDTKPNYTKPYDQSGITAATACNHLLGKSISHSKEQKLAMHVNTRHMALHYPSSDMGHGQHGILAPEQPQSEPSVEGIQSQSISEGNSMKMDVSSENAIGNKCRDTMEADVQSVNSSVLGHNNSTTPPSTNASTSSNGPSTSGKQISANSNAASPTKLTFHARQHKQDKPYDVFSSPSSVPSKAKSPTFHSDHRINAIASGSQTAMGYMGTRGVAQTKSLKSIQSWTNALRYICDIHKGQLWCELFGDEPAFMEGAPDLLKLLKDIDQKKNQITYEEEQATGLITAISEVLEACYNSAGEESIMLAGKILDNLLQRFQDTWFYGDSD